MSHDNSVVIKNIVDNGCKLNFATFGSFTERGPEETLADERIDLLFSNARGNPRTTKNTDNSPQNESAVSANMLRFSTEDSHLRVLTQRLIAERDDIDAEMQS